jgi:hypothetical protein
MGKKVLIGVGVIIVLLLVIVWQVGSNLDKIVAGVIEDVGSDVLKTSVSVSGVEIDLKGAKAGIAGMTIANPKGYSRANLFELEGISVDLDIKTVTQDNASGGSNMQTLLDNIESGASDGDVAAGGEAMKMIIDRFEFSGGLVKASSEMKPGEVMDIKLPAIKISGIGRAQGGVTADVVAQKIGKELVSEIISAAAKAGVNKALEEKKKGFLDKLKGD